MTTQRIIVGVLALQGAFSEHVNAIKFLGHETKLIREKGQLKNMDALIIPGGESTTIELLARECGLWEDMTDFIKSGKPIWGTCAGLILLSSSIENPAKTVKQEPLRGLPVVVERNHFGGQVNSFIGSVNVDGVGDVTGVFIRAPVVTKVLDPKCKIIAKTADGLIVGVRYNNILGTAFHPEFTNDYRMHSYFVDIILQNKKN